MRRIFILLLVGLTQSIAFAASPARESLGDFRLTDLYLEPRFYFREPQQSNFQIDNSYIGVRWRYDDQVSAYLQIGHASLLGKPFYYGAESREWTATQAYGEWTSSIGEFRFGLVPLAYGFEGGYQEDQLPFPRSLIFQNRVVPRADFGATYAVESRGFYTEMTAHNGETEADRDGQTWFTARWGWHNKYGLNLGFSGMTGRTKPESTSDQSVNPAVSRSTSVRDLDGVQGSHVRVVNFFGETVWERLRIMVDAHVGQIRQQQTAHAIRGGHLDLQLNLSDRLDGLARYDEWDTNMDGGQGMQRQYFVGAALKSLYRNSVLSLFATRETIDESGANPSHGILLVWKLTPNF